MGYCGLSLRQRGAAAWDALALSSVHGGPALVRTAGTSWGFRAACRRYIEAAKARLYGGDEAAAAQVGQD